MKRKLFLFSLFLAQLPFVEMIQGQEFPEFVCASVGAEEVNNTAGLYWFSGKWTPVV